MAAAGVSIMIPSSTSPISTPVATSSSLTCFEISFILLTSSTDVIIGYMIAIFPYALALYKARSCVLNTSSLVRQILIAL